MSGPGGWTFAKDSFFTDTYKSGNKFESTFHHITAVASRKTHLRTRDDFDSVIRTPPEKGSIHLIESGGENIACLGISKNFMASLCKCWSVPELFVEKLLMPGPLPLLVHHFERTDKEHRHTLCAANFGFRWGQGHNEFMISFGRYDFEKENLCVLLCSRGLVDATAGIRRNDDNIIDTAELILRLKFCLEQEPLSFIGVLLDVCQRDIAVHAQGCNIGMLRASAALDALLSPDLVAWIRKWGLEPLEPPSSKSKIDMLYSNYNDVIWGEKACSELISLAKRYLDIVEGAKEEYQLSLPTYLIQEVVHRAELHSHMFSYLVKAVTTQFTHQYNHLVQKDTEASIEISNASKDIAVATRRDSLAMKTVAYLTLAFLPTTFVSAIFSTTIFDFQNMHSKENSGRVVSPGWWIFVLVAVISTLITLGVWRVWEVMKLKQEGEYQKNKSQSSNGELTPLPQHPRSEIA